MQLKLDIEKKTWNETRLTAAS